MAQQEVQYEERLLNNVRTMTEKDRAWILALSDRCAQPQQKDPDEAYVVLGHSTARE